MRGEHAKGAELWQVTVAVPDAAAAAAVMPALETACVAVSAFEATPEPGWRVEGLAAARPDRALLEALCELAWRGPAAGVPAAGPEMRIERLRRRDWVRENQASFSPVRVGRYLIHGSHWRKGLPPGRIALLVDAATAFGTGEHATTRGCLLALDRLARAGRPRRILDMGTGTGILALAAARTWHRRVWARDNDREAARVAALNAARNGVAGLVEARHGAGYGDRGLRRAAPFDLILANILARPLATMAPALARMLAPGGVAILSGLLARQEPLVLASHRARRLRLARRLAIDGWSTLVLVRERSPLRP